MNKPLPCPCCGGEAMSYEIEPHTHFIATFMPDHPGSGYVECTGCTLGCSGETKEEAINTWNTRPIHDVEKELKSVLGE